MKIFITTSFLALGLLVATSLVMSCYYLEKYRTKSEDLQNENNDLKDEVLKYEYLYLKCQGDSVTERLGAHYLDGKINFYCYDNN